LKPDSNYKPAVKPSKALRNALLLAPVALFPFVLIGVLFLFRSTGQKRAVADAAIYMAQASPKVAAEIGLPISPGWPVHGHVLEKGDGGNADLTIRLNGSRAVGTLTEWAQRSQGKWHICSLNFTSPDRPPLQLVDPAQTHCEPE
jgi:hypothetical protein